MAFEREYDSFINRECYTNPLLKAIPQSLRNVIWEQICERYLQRYSLLVRVEFDWGSSGLWRPPFPGSILGGPMYTLESFPELPSTVVQRLTDWIDFQDEHALNNNAFDYDASNKEGLLTAIELRKHLPETVYLEFGSSFQEIKQLNGEVMVMDVPYFIQTWQS